MEKYIPLDAVVAEIEKLKGKVSDGSSYCNGWQHALRMLEIELKTLKMKEVDTEQLNKLLNWWKEVTTEYSSMFKVKEVDLDKEIDNYISSNFFGSQTMGFFANRTKEEPNDIDMALCAKHFFELGLKAQKGE